MATLEACFHIGVDLLQDEVLAVVLHGTVGCLQLKPLELPLFTMFVHGRNANNALVVGGLHHNRRLWLQRTQIGEIS